MMPGLLVLDDKFAAGVGVPRSLHFVVFNEISML